MSTIGSQEFQEQLVNDAAAATRGLTIALGDRLGLYAAMADSEAVTVPALAERTGLQPLYVREWLHAQVSGGYLTVEPDGAGYRLPADHVPALADEDSPLFTAPFFSTLKALYGTEDGLATAYRAGGGVGWDEHDTSLDDALSRYFLPGYRAHLVARWLPALDGVPDKLSSGARVADVGCGVGYSTFLMAAAFPESHFAGSDYFADAVA